MSAGGLSNRGRWPTWQRATMERLKSELSVSRSAYTVNSSCHVGGRVNWAADLEWLPKRIRFTATSCDDPDKGRPITLEEFERMLAAVEKVCRRDPESWRFLLRGLWESGCGSVKR